MIFDNYLKGFIDVLIPKGCLLCGQKTRGSAFLCGNCSVFESISHPLCKKCGRHVPLGPQASICSRCTRSNFSFSSHRSPFLYKGPLVELIHIFKYKGFSFCMLEGLKANDDGFIDEEDIN